MHTLPVKLQRFADTSLGNPFSGLISAVKKIAVKKDDREQYLSQAINHADLAARERAYEDHEARTRAFFSLR